MRNLQTLLQLHLRCNHGIGAECIDGEWHVAHGKHERFTFSDGHDDRSAPERGSAAFHEIVRGIMAVEPHERHELHITDEEYAAIVGDT